MFDQSYLGSTRKVKKCELYLSILAKMTDILRTLSFMSLTLGLAHSDGILFLEFNHLQALQIESVSED